MGKQDIFNSLNKTYYHYIGILFEKQKNLTRGIIIKGPLNSINSKHFKMNLRLSEGQKLN